MADEQSGAANVKVAGLRRLRRRLKRFVPALVLESRQYLGSHGRLPNLYRPTYLTEKILLRKLYDRNPLFPLCSDKYAVRGYVNARIGEGYLVPVVAVTETPEDLLELASWQMTVMKPNHGSLMVQINGDEEPSPEQKRWHVSRFRRWLELDYSAYYGEWQYAGIPRKLIVERNIAGPGTTLIEWKFHCFRQPDGSTVMMLQVISERFKSKSMAFYLDHENSYDLVGSLGEPPPMISEADRPLLMEAREKSVMLSDDFDYVRVDWMVAKGELYFSELTFTPGAGFSTSFGPDLDRRLGKLWMRRGDRRSTSQRQSEGQHSS